MKHTLSARALRHAGTYGLAALVTGLLLTPLSYIAIGMLGEFSAAFTLLFVPPLIVCEWLLLGRLLSRASERARHGLGAIAALAAWAYVGFFTVVVSGARLQVGWARFGALCMLWLACSALTYPALALRWRNAALVRRTAGWRPAPWAFLCAFALAAGICTLYLLTPQRLP
ncbi:hypothetical protein [Xanthomonas medicagonis]|uniref:hypothetical protein n=1 Tax=Xanthomonas medicagonis TaxID=3160841 RepID=UPI0035116B4E